MLDTIPWLIISMIWLFVFHLEKNKHRTELDEMKSKLSRTERELRDARKRVETALTAAEAVNALNRNLAMQVDQYREREYDGEFNDDADQAMHIDPIIEQLARQPLPPKRDGRRKIKI